MKFIIVVLLFFGLQFSYACTTILIGKDATKDGSVILAHNEDMGKETAGVLRYYKGEKYSPKFMIKVPYVEIDQVAETLSFWGAGNAENVLGLGVENKLPYTYNHLLAGMNESGVAIACNWMNSKDENLKEVGIRRYAIRQLVLERAKTSREAVDLITHFIDKFGQADWSGLTYNVADSKEAWIIETTARQWVTRRIRDDEIWVVANRFTITDDYDTASEGLVEYAFEKNWIPTKKNKLNFREVYGKFPENAQDYDISREELVQKELSKYKGEIDINMLMKMLKHRYENAANFKPILEECWRAYCNEKNVKRPISSCLTQSSVIATLHPKYKAIGGKMWYLHASPHVGIYFPLYGSLKNIHPDFENADGQDKNSNWWKWRQLQSSLDEDYQTQFKAFKKTQDQLQNEIVLDNINFELLNKPNLSDWEVHQKKLSGMAVQILGD